MNMNKIYNYNIKQELTNLQKMRVSMNKECKRKKDMFNNTKTHLYFCYDEVHRELNKQMDFKEYMAQFGYIGISQDIKYPETHIFNIKNGINPNKIFYKAWEGRDINDLGWIVIGTYDNRADALRAEQSLRPYPYIAWNADMGGRKQDEGISDAYKHYDHMIDTSAIAWAEYFEDEDINKTLDCLEWGALLNDMECIKALANYYTNLKAKTVFHQMRNERKANEWNRYINLHNSYDDYMLEVEINIDKYVEEQSRLKAIAMPVNTFNEYAHERI